MTSLIELCPQIQQLGSFNHSCIEKADTVPPLSLAANFFSSSNLFITTKNLPVAYSETSSDAELEQIVSYVT